MRFERILTSLGTMVTDTCYTCRVPFAMSLETFNTLQRQATSGKFFCPLGHSQHYTDGETQADKMRRERDRAVQQQAYLQDRLNEKNARLDEEKRRAAAARGQVTRIKNRVGKGGCPCCNRTFENLQGHMVSKHGDYLHEQAA